jgi:hypothetical protein
MTRLVDETSSGLTSMAPHHSGLPSVTIPAGSMKTCILHCCFKCELRCRGLIFMSRDTPSSPERAPKPFTPSADTTFYRRCFGEHEMLQFLFEAKLPDWPRCECSPDSFLPS